MSMTSEFHHGTRVNQSGEEPVLVSLRSTSTGGLVFPIAEEDLPANRTFERPFLVNSAEDAASLPDRVKEDIDSFYDQVQGPIVVSLV